MHPTLIWPRQGEEDGVRTADITQHLAEDRTSTGLFSQPYGPVEVAAAEVAPQGTEECFLDTEGALREHLSIHHASAPSYTSEAYREETKDADCLRSSFFLLDPAYGWSNLPVTLSGMLSLLEALDVYPEVYRYIKAFGRKSFAKDEGFAGFDSITTLDGSGQWASFESCYLLKYVGIREDARPGTIPWSIRHALIYQKINIETKHSSHILIRLPEQVKGQLATSIRERGSKSDFVRDWAHLHGVCFSSIDSDLRNMINYLDEEVTEVFDRVIMSEVDPAKLNVLDSVQSSAKDFKTLQFLADQARRLIKAIELNMATINCLRRDLDQLVAASPPTGVGNNSLAAVIEKIQKTQQEHEFSLKNASSVLDRAIATSRHLRDTTSLRNSEISKLNAERANQNTMAIAQLADQSSRETHVVKSLTVLALVFVPASFVADFLQMGFITITQEQPMRWEAEAGLKIYAVLAIPLIATTMLIYGCVEVLQRSRGIKD
ncbi:hypothetical protein BHE90_005787 [Fusarium euwallaceae]|uniref:CorA-like transporter domain-containing protein n=1 Tax=Fusarium euwallaceae TaxID=1147111 RepID=A0A430LVJ4_9HYPO|nr:hypothetical protein BHE90_005787 [Fusarium euwallaceae]